MMKVFLPIKLFLFLSLISICLSFGVISHKFTKSPLDSGDKRFNNALSLITKRVVEKKGGSKNTKVVPVAAFRNLDNGVHYKLLAAVTDLNTKKVDLVESDVFTPFSDKDVQRLFIYSNSDMITPRYVKRPGILWDEIKDFSIKQLALQKISTAKVNSIYGTYKILNNTSYYVVDMDVKSKGKTYIKNLIISREYGKDFEVLHSFDFPL